MMLPILISLSLAPGSYFFCAWAEVAVNAAIAARIADRPTRLRTVIILSRLVFCFAGVSQALHGLASIGLFREAKRDCCAPPIMIDAWHAPVPSQGRFRFEPEPTNWCQASEARGVRIPRGAMAGGENVPGRGLSSARFGICRCADRAYPRQAGARRNGLSR